ncbi:Glycosyl transferase [Sterolibacterium denitrificans]|uniref:Glycosyl transferase n=1 Tax=Sterolibacterium denitrificans TaxID=157592 RepID=A0A7Z7MUS9_9PROT|nr:Glycosyl transferase [Sterolibacterium denitrificans]
MRSVLAQTCGDFELLFLDDGSEDDSVEIARSFPDGRIRVLSDGIGKGLPRRLNEGVQLARGKYIARMDADDVCFPMRFEKQVAFLESHPEVDLLGCRAVVFRDSGKAMGLLPFAKDHEALCARPWRNISLPHPSWMGRREWFEAHPYRLPEVRRAEDQELLLRGHLDSRYACLEEVLLAYRQGPFQLKRTLVARRSLLVAQLDWFVGQKAWGNVFRALALSSVKVMVDGLAALPGGEALFFRRMGEPVPEEVFHVFRQCLATWDAPEK